MIKKAPHARLRLARMKAGYRSSKEAAQAHGWNENSYKSHENGARNLTRAAAETYAKAFRVDVAWLLLGTRVHRKAGLGIGALSDNLRRIPVISLEAAALMVTNPKETESFATKFTFIHADPDLSEDLAAIELTDDSMTASGPAAVTFRAGDQVVFNLHPSYVPPGAFVLAVPKGAKAALFRQYIELGRRHGLSGPEFIELRPLNTAFASSTHPKARVLILGVARRQVLRIQP